MSPPSYCILARLFNERGFSQFGRFNMVRLGMNEFCWVIFFLAAATVNETLCWNLNLVLHRALPLLVDHDTNGHAFPAVAVVALNTRLGCLSPRLSEGSEAKKMIRASITSFETVRRLEFALPFWKVIQTPLLRRLFEAQDFFTE